MHGNQCDTERHKCSISLDLLDKSSVYLLALSVTTANRADCLYAISLFLSVLLILHY